MGRYLFEFIVPGMIALYGAYWLARYLWLRRGSRVVKDVNVVRLASARYEKDLKEGK